jgi:uncharacterized membrane protein (TIGR02234 family)
MRDRGEFAGALLLQLLGAAGALLLATRHWQTITTPRPRPFRDDVLSVTGRTADAAPTALALVALAGVIAVIATRGVVRRLIGIVVAFAGAALVWRSLAALGAVSQSRARSLVESKHSGAEVGAAARIDVHAVWPVLSVCCGALLLIAGVLVVWRGHRWGAMSAKYDRPAGGGAGEDEQQARARADASLWSALDRGVDPTEPTER